MVEKETVLSVAKSIVATVAMFVILTIVFDIINEILTGERYFNATEFILGLTGPEVTLALLLAMSSLFVFMMWSLLRK